MWSVIIPRTVSVIDAINLTIGVFGKWEPETGTNWRLYAYSSRKDCYVIMLETLHAYIAVPMYDPNKLVKLSGSVWLHGGVKRSMTYAGLLAIFTRLAYASII